MKYANLILMLIATLTQITDGYAAEISKLTVPGFSGYEMIIIKGDIVNGDSQRFIDVAKSTRKATVVLTSQGGSVHEALKIGRMIRDLDWATMVLPEDYCYSACGLIWISSQRRYLSQSSSIGFHAAYKNVYGVNKETGMGNAEIGSYLTHIGLGIEAIRFITQAPPEGMNIMTPKIARALGVSVFEQDGFNVDTPNDKPTADTHLKRAAFLLATQDTCKAYYDYHSNELEQEAKRSINSAKQLTTSELYSIQSESAINMVDDELNEKGEIQWCIDSADRLKDYGLLLRTAPSFNCKKAKIQAELAICRNPKLSISDRIVSSMFSLTSFAEPSIAEKTREGQKKWIKLRNECSDDVECLQSAYKMRIQQLRR